MKISGYRLDEIMAERRHIGPVCAAAQGLYAELCRQYNKFPDPAGFECSNTDLKAALFCSKNSLEKYRDELVAAGLVDYLSRQEEKKPGIYKILDLGKAGLTGSNFDHDSEAATSKFDHAKTPTTSKFDHDTPLTGSNFDHVEEKTETPAWSNNDLEHGQNLTTTLNKSKVVSTNVLTLSPKKGAAEKKEDSSFPETSFPKIPTVTDPFEAFELPPAAPPFCAAPPQAEMPAENPTAAPAKTKRQPSPKFQKPTHQELEAYFQDRRQEWPAATCKDEAETFHDHYTSNGWKVGTAKTPMQDWQAAVRNWLKRTFSNARSHNNSTPTGKVAGNSKTGAAATPRKGGGTIEELQALKRRRPANTPERTEFTDATVVE